MSIFNNNVSFWAHDLETTDKMLNGKFFNFLYFTTTVAYIQHNHEMKKEKNT